MAVSKLWKVTERLGQVIDYATNPEKTANPEYSQEEYQALKDVLAYAKDEKISKISGRLKELRKEVKLCDGIAERSGVMKQNLEQLQAEEEKSKRKENRSYDKRR